MKLSVKGLALSLGLVWGGCLLVVGLAAYFIGGEGDYYGKDFMLAMASVYPGYRGLPEIGDTLMGALYGLLDGMIGGAIVAWLYNAFAGSGKSG